MRAMPAPYTLFFLSLVLLVCVACPALCLHGGTPNGLQDVEVGAPITVQPISVDGFVESSPGVKPGDLVACTRVRIPGLSRLKNLQKFTHTTRVKVDASATPSFKLSLPKVEVCFHWNSSLGLGQCLKDSWRVLDKGSWTGTMSPFQTQYLDIRTTESHTDVSLNVSIHEERRAYRLVFLALGMALLVIAPIVSGWVPFYYSSAMTLGIFLVLLILLYQGMKLLPTGRKSSLYIILYGSMVGLGTVVLHYFSGFLSTVLLELGVADELFNPVAILVLVAIGLLGAWLGYWGVRKLVLSEDGVVDAGTAVFVKWAIRVIGGVMLLQTSHDPVFAVLVLALGSNIAWLVGQLHSETIDFSEYFQCRWSESLDIRPASLHSPVRGGKKPYMNQTQMDTLQNVPGKEALVMWEQVSALSQRPHLDLSEHCEMLPEHCEVLRENGEMVLGQNEMVPEHNERNIDLQSLSSDDWDRGGLFEESLSLPDHIFPDMACCSSEPRCRVQKSAALLRNEFYSTYHKTSGGKPLTRDEYKATNVTEKAIAELVKTDKFQEWWSGTVVANNRVSIAPNEHRQERNEDEIELTAYMGQDGYCFGKYADCRKSYQGSKY